MKMSRLGTSLNRRSCCPIHAANSFLIRNSAGRVLRLRRPLALSAPGGPSVPTRRVWRMGGRAGRLAALGQALQRCPPSP
jgi:hypothetical protein